MNGALLLTALFNGAWQGAVLCTLAYFALRTQRRLNATTMFAVWSVLLAIALALPAANYVFAARPYTVHVEPAQVEKPAAVQWHAVRATAAKQSPRAAAFTATSNIAPPAPSLRDIAIGGIAWVLDRAQIALLLVLGLAALRVGLLVRDIIGMFAARRAARRIQPPFTLRGSIHRRYAFAASDDLKSPCVLGFSPALIVIPEDLLDAPENELLSVILHEREHVRRYDDVQNVLHRLIGAIAFFCPGVRIALRELALYREQICDDAAVNGIGDAVSYAMTLTGMAQWAQGRGVPVPSLIFKRKQLLHRLEVLLDKAVNHSLRMNRRFAAASAVATLLAAAIVLRLQVPVIAKAIVAPLPPPKPAVHVAYKPAATRVVQAPVKPKTRPAATAAPKPAKTPMPLLLSPRPARIAARTAPKIARVIAAQAFSVAPVTPKAIVAANVLVPRVVAYAPDPPKQARSNDILDALDAAGIHNLSVDELIAIRDHGVSTSLIRAAVAYFGPRLSADTLVALADHGVSPSYLDSLRVEGVTGIAPASVVMLMDHGVSGSLIAAARAYFAPPRSAADLVYLADRGVGASYITSMRLAGVLGIGVGDMVRLMDHGVDARYILKVRRFNPRASLDDIIRLHDAGF